MDFRFIQGSTLARFLGGGVKASRNLGLGASICVILGSSAFAQTTLDFIDPLDTERTRVEERSGPVERAAPPRERAPSRFSAPAERNDGSVLTRARDGAEAGTTAMRDGATGFWGTVRGALSSVAAALGLSTAGLVALLGLLIAGIAALVGWTLFRGRRRYAASPQDDVYARSSREAVKRRAMGSALKSRPATAPGDDDFEETMPDDFDAIFTEERTEPAPRREPRPDPRPDTRDEPVEKPATAGWRKPNLDRLRDSIKADWKADKAEKAEKADPRPTASPAASARRPDPRPVATATASDPASRTLDDLSDGWEEWDMQDKPEEDLWGETLPAGQAAQKDGDDTATNRIRALRESLRAS